MTSDGTGREAHRRTDGGAGRRAHRGTNGGALAGLIVWPTGLLWWWTAIPFALRTSARWFPVAEALPEIDVRLLWYARLDADPAQRWLRQTITEAVGQ